MTDKVQKIREKVVEMVNSINPFIPDEDGKNSDYEAGKLDAATQVLQIIDSFEEPVSEEIGDYDHKAVMESLYPELKEEPVSEELEEAAKHNTFKYVFDKNVKETLISELKYIGDNSFKDGVEWQKRKDDELLTVAYMDGVENGKKQALKDIPKWKIFRNTKYAGEMFDSRNVIIVPYHGTTYEIWLQDLLDKLPKED